MGKRRVNGSPRARRAFTGLVLVALVLGLLVWRLRSAPPEPEVSVSTEHTVEREPPPVPMEEAEQQEPEKNVEPVAATTVEEATALELDGMWVMHQAGTARASTRDVSTTVIVELSQEGSRVEAVEFRARPSRARRFNGEVKDGRVVFSLYDVFGVMWGTNFSAAEKAQRNELSGPVSRSFTRIRLDGVHPIDFSDPESPLSDVHVVMSKLDDADADAERLIQELTVEVRELRDAILAYAYDHRGSLPRSLQDLVPKYIQRLESVTDNARRTLVYDPEAVDLLSVVRPASDIEHYHPELSLRERLTRWEEDLTAHYGSQFPAPETLLQVRVGRTPVEIHAGFRGAPEVRREDAAAHNSAEPAQADWLGQARQRANVEVCQSQLKQIGLALAIFAGQTDENYIPAGWRTLVPEFIESPSMLTCPNHEHGTLSYRLAFPAASRAQLAAIYADVHGLDPETVNLDDVWGTMPIAYEETAHEVGPHSVRQVVYVDGHVESVAAGDWGRSVEPYLQYSVQ